MRNCSKCKQDKQDTSFQLHRDKPSGQCRECKTEAEKQRRARLGMKSREFSLVINSSKLCCGCKEFKELSDFSPSKRGRAGVSAYCKVCTTNLFKPSKEKARERTQKYRDINREWWRSLHRLNQFNRRKTIKAISDNSVGKSFVKLIYSQEICHYCSKRISQEERTLEHKQPLSKGGMHSSTNIVMACIRCNTSKRDMTEQQFKNYRDGNIC